MNVANSTGSPVTLLVTDWAGNPLIPTYAIPANTVYQFSQSDGDYAYLVGLKWQAGGSGLYAEYCIFAGTQVAPGVNWSFSVSDSATVTDTPIAVFVLKASVSDSATVTDTPSLVIANTISVSEGLTVTDTPSFLYKQYNEFNAELVHVQETVDFVVS